MISMDYYFLGTAFLLLMAVVWIPPRPLQTKAEKFRRLEEICIHDRTISLRLPVSAKDAADQPTLSPAVHPLHESTAPVC